MEILLNNKNESIPGREQIKVEELLELKKYTFKFLVVKINGRVIKPEEYPVAIISDGDKVQVLHLISGG